MDQWAWIFLLVAVVFIGVTGILFAWNATSQPTQPMQATQPAQPTSYEPPEGTILINLERRKDRLDTFMQHWSASDVNTLKIHHLKAADWQTMDWESLVPADIAAKIKQRKRNPNMELTEGAVGCFASHMQAYEFIARQEKPWVIFEDDLVVSPTAKKDMESVLATLPFHKDALVLFFYNCNSGEWSELRADPLSGNHGNYEIKRFWSTAAYYVTPYMAKKLLELMRPPYRLQIDSKLSELIGQGHMKAYGRKIFHLFGAGSDIQYFGYD